MYLQSSYDSFSVEDIGNCSLRAYNDLGQSWLLVIQTILGFSYILEYGPLNNNGEIPNYLFSRFDKIEYSEYKLEKRIDKFLNDPKRLITQVEEYDLNEALLLMRNAAEVFNEACQ